MSGTSPHPLPLSTLLGRVQSLFAAEYDRRLAAAAMPDLSLSLGANVLRHLHGDEPVRMGTLVAMSGVTKQAISQQVAHLEDRGYVVVAQDLADSRAKVVRLTGRGVESQHTARRLFVELEQDWQNRFGADHIRELRAGLERILTESDDTDVLPRGHHPSP